MIWAFWQAYSCKCLQMPKGTWGSVPNDYWVHFTAARPAVLSMNFACTSCSAVHILTRGHKRSKDQALEHKWAKRAIERPLLEYVSGWKCQQWLMGETSVPGWHFQIGVTLAVNFRFGNCWPGLCSAAASAPGLFWHATSHSKSSCLQTV